MQRDGCDQDAQADAWLLESTMSSLSRGVSIGTLLGASIKGCCHIHHVMMTDGGPCSQHQQLDMHSMVHVQRLTLKTHVQLKQCFWFPRSPLAEECNTCDVF